MLNKEDMIKEIKRLKEEKDVLILAHNYQIPEIQEIADIVGDSLKLSQEASKAKENTILLSGVHFMAESVKILSPNKKVLLPVLDAGCPMADMIDKDKLIEFKKANKGAKVITYVNSTAEVKAESDICCTSSNALKIVNKIDADKILFVPDQNLGNYIKSKVEDKEIIPYEGYCITHHRVRREEALRAKELNPDALLLAHPECREEVLEEADFIGSTSEIINYASKSDNKKFIIGTEMGVLYKLEKDNPNKKFYLLSPSFICTNMKKTRLEDIYIALRDDKNEIHIDEEIRKKAFNSLDEMLKLSE